MQRKVTLIEPVREESTRYFVNNVECKRDAIYQTILDNKFYNGKVSLNKKYHFELREEKIVEDKEEHKSEYEYSLTTCREASKHSKSSNRNASFSLETKKFADKFNPTSQEYKSLIEKMVHAVDMLDEAANDYSKYSEKNRIAFRNLMVYLLEHLGNYERPYNDIVHKFSIELVTLLIDMQAFGLSRIMDEHTSSKVELPSLKFDTSSIKESWDDDWTNIKKSEFLEKYLSIMLKQTNVFCQLWIENDTFSDKSSRNEIQSKFDELKKLITSLQAKKAFFDVTLLSDAQRLSVTSNVASFFHHAQNQSNQYDLQNISSVSDHKKFKNQ